MNTVRAKLSAGLGFLVIVIIAMGLLNWSQGERIVAATSSLYSRGVLVTQALGNANANLHRVQTLALSHASASTDREQRAIEQQLAALDQKVMQNLDDARASMISTTRQAMVDEIRRNFAQYIKQRDESALPLSRSGNRETALSVLLGDSGELFDRTVSFLNDLSLQQVEAVRGVKESADDTVKGAMWSGLIGAGITALIGLVVASMLSRSISSRLWTLTEMARALAEGRLRHRSDLKGEDEIAELARNFDNMANTLESMLETQTAERDRLAKTLAIYGAFVERIASGDLTATKVDAPDGELFNLGQNLGSMNQALRGMTQRIHEAVGALSGASAEIQATIQQHAASAAESASAVAETVASVDEVAQSAQQVAITAQGVQENSRRSLEVSGAGQLAIRKSTEAMHAVRNQVQSIAERILALSEEAQEVGQIVATVNELAEQSNVLSLNASIEAARAGEHGRGFAVVAQEIRALAEQSRQATSLVRDMLTNIQKSTSKAVLVTEEGTKSVIQAVETVRAAGERIEQLAEVIEGAASSAEQIRSGAQQQVQGIAQISQAMRSIDDAARQGVDGTRNIERAARELNTVSTRLQQAVSQYRT